MKSYTLLWTNNTFDRYVEDLRFHGSREIDYVAFDEKRPLSEIIEKDEIFVVTVRKGMLFLAGRLIAAGSPISKHEAIQQIGKDDLIDKDLYLIADKDSADTFRPSCRVDLEVAKNIELIKVDGSTVKPQLEENGLIYKQAFRSPLEISRKSADILREILSRSIENEINGDILKASRIGTTGSKHTKLDRVDSVSELSPEDERICKFLKTRRGQGKFRNRLLEAYGCRCCVTESHTVEVLEAAHISPHSDESDYSLANGLLLRSDIHTLFDLYLLAIDENGRICVAGSVKETIYRKLHGQKITLPIHGEAPSAEALAARFERYKELNGAEAEVYVSKFSRASRTKLA